MRLIITFDDNPTGQLKRAGFADRVVPLDRRFVWGRLPSPSKLKNWTRADYIALSEFCERFDAIELWVDPEPNSQLQLLWVLEYLRPHEDVVSRLNLAQTNTSIDGLRTEEWIAQRPRAVPIHSDHLEVASAAWAAWRALTPEAWFDLLAQDLSAIPRLRSTVAALLEELPTRTSGLGKTEMRLLELVAAGNDHPYDLFPGHEKPNELITYGYWEVGRLLDGLARGPKPAVSGLTEGPFDLDMHNSQDRHDRYKNSTLSLTDLGKQILAGTDDFSRHNPIHRWWAGTELTNDRLWRWDPDNQSLIAP
ncbi:MAG: hypothetical protein ACJ8DV_05545 [Microvirga sp.]